MHNYEGSTCGFNLGDYADCNVQHTALSTEPCIP